jgi:hypothetical protein
MVNVHSQSEKERNTGLIIGIIIFTLLSFFVVSILVILLTTMNPAPEPQYSIASGYFMASCAQTPCNSGLICDGTDFICRYGTGTICDSAFDCGPGLTCSGRCVSGPYGGLDDYCPCNDGYQCQVNTDGSTTCKGISGTICSHNRDCISNVCYNGICMSGNLNSYPCTVNSDCSSNNCSNHFCQPYQLTTGTLGASCAGNCLNLPSGTSGASCSGDLSCYCVYGVNAPGVCIRSDQGIGDPCNVINLCSNDLVCYNTSGVTCGRDDLGCQCLFPYPNPNQPVYSNCIVGMDLRNSPPRLCLNGPTLGCNSGTMCVSNSCIGPPVTVVYNFSNNGNLGTDFLRATNTTLLAGFTGPNQQITPYKMFGTSDGALDTIYLVDRSSGFYSITYDTSQNKAGSWTQWFSNNTQYGTLDDVSYDGTLFIVSFSNTLYLWLLSTNTFNLFNNGLQYTTQGVPLTVDYLSISPANPNSGGDDIIITSQGTAYLKSAPDLYYEPILTNTTGPVSFYYDTSGASQDNISFVTNYNNYQQILQFTGTMTGQLEPLDIFGNLQYLVFDYNIYSPTLPTEDTSAGMADASTIMLTTTTTGINVVALNYAGTTTIVPYNFNETSRCTATNNAFYIISKASCA